MGKLGFVGNEADPNALLKPPLRYIAQGSNAQIKAVISAAEAEKWIITLTVNGSEGPNLVEFQSGETMTNGQAWPLLERIWKMEFGDIAFGPAPRKLSDPNQSED